MEELERTAVTARFYKKLNKQMGDWSALLCFTNDVENLPTSVEVREGKAYINITGNNLPELENVNIKFFGHWTQNKYGTQLKADSYEILMPNTEKGLISFLSGPTFPGIGIKTATAIVKEYGQDVINIIEQDPNALLVIKGITPQKLGMIVENYESVQSYSRLSVFLSTFGVGASVIQKINKKYGKNAISLIQDNPYVLSNVSGVGFKTCDRIGRGLGVALDSYKRIEGATLEVLKNTCDSHGDMYMMDDELQVNVLKLLNEGFDNPVVDSEKYKSAFDIMNHNFHKIVVRSNHCIYLKEYDDAEYNSCQKLLWLLNNKIPEMYFLRIDKEVEKINSTAEIKLSEKQKEAVKLSLKNRVSVITGGPGTGKTTIINTLTKCYENVFHEEITQMAPTGKAARRMTEATHRQASTIHSKLQIFGNTLTTDNDSLSKIYNGLIIIDETSMVDNILLEKVLSAIANNNCHLVFVGDIHQLPSIGVGSVLGEMIYSNVIPSTTLTEIFRQKDGGSIVENAIQINSGRTHLKYDASFEFVEAESESKATDIILEIYNKEVAKRGADNVALLTPLRKDQNGRFSCVSDVLNQKLQDTINPLKENTSSCKVHNKTFRIWDRVMQWKNTKTSANGDVGEIIGIHQTSEEGLLVNVLWENGNNVFLNLEDMETIDLAYAMSVHKSQGSEYECVIIPMISNQKCQLFRRNMLYTAVTRAKQKVILVGDKKAIDYCITHSDTNKRKTLLAQRLIYNYSSN